MENKKEILKDLLISAQTNCVVKIKLKDIPNPIITAVERADKDHILLKPTCLHGYELAKRTITPAEIQGVTRYKTNFHHPIFEKLRFITNNISAIRHGLQAFNQRPSPSQTFTR